MYPQSVLSKNKKNINIFSGKFFIFTAQKICLLHGRVFIMYKRNLFFLIQRMRQGVLNDIERQAQKKRDRLEKQQELAQLMQQEQNKDTG